MKMSNSVYDVLKWVCQIVLPALSALYATLGKVWGLPYTSEIPATIMAIDACLGACLQVSSANYQKEDA